jgi:hypothetical protein
MKGKFCAKNTMFAEFAAQVCDRNMTAITGVRDGDHKQLFECYNFMREGGVRLCAPLTA